MIDSYSFGKIVVNGKKYKNDIILYKNEIIKEVWWRKEGHELSILDIKDEIDKFSPEIIVIGCGKFGVLKVLTETKDYLKKKNIKLVAEKTSKACEIFNKLSVNHKIVGAFHLTC